MNVLAKHQYENGGFGGLYYELDYRGEDTTPIESEDKRIKDYAHEEKVCFAAFVSYSSELVSEELYLNILKHPIELFYHTK